MKCIGMATRTLDRRGGKGCHAQMGGGIKSVLVAGRCRIYRLCRLFLACAVAGTLGTNENEADDDHGRMPLQ